MIVPSETVTYDKADEISEGIIVIVTSKTQIFSSKKPVILSNFVRSEQGKEIKVCSVVLCYREF